MELSGSLGTLTDVGVNAGALMPFFLVYLCSKATGDLSAQSYWMLVFAFPFLTVLLQTVMLLWVFPYETPKYLLINGQ